MIFSKHANQDSYPFILPELPYLYDSLSPYMSSETFEYHHGKHHNAYVVNLNKLLESDQSMHSLDLETIIKKTANNSLTAAIFNNAAQVWNHSFFWHSMSSSGGSEPKAELMDRIKEDFGSYSEFLSQFKQIGVSQFGSGWVWLVWDGKKLSIKKTANAETPITDGLYPIICCDVWEHAYYIDYRNRRPDFLSIFVDKLANWNFAGDNFKNALSYF